MAYSSKGAHLCCSGSGDYFRRELRCGADDLFVQKATIIVGDRERILLEGGASNGGAGGHCQWSQELPI